MNILIVIAIRCTQTFAYFDSINNPKALIDKAVELGLKGIAITDHEVLSAHIEAMEYVEKYPDFKLGLGNEIYLVKDRESGQKYFHFILIAKDAIGHRALRELSSQSWFYSYMDRGLERVPTLYKELEEIVNRFKGHLIATTACRGSQLGVAIMNMTQAEKENNLEEKTKQYNIIMEYLQFCKKLFVEDFYLELAPSADPEQIMINKRIVKIAEALNFKTCIGNDAHYLTKDQRQIHKAYLNSKEGEREIDDFYQYTYLKDEKEVRELLSLALTPEEVESAIAGSLDIENKITRYSLTHRQIVPTAEVKDFPKSEELAQEVKDYPNLSRLFTSDDIQDRYWVNTCWTALKKKFGNNKVYIDELEEEARVKTIVGEKLETNIFAYPNTLQHYIDLFWDCGSTVGAGRGSAGAALNHLLMGITQIDPIKWDLPFFRYLNEERVDSLPDVDVDISAAKRPTIIKRIKEERKKYFNEDVADWAKDNLGCVLVATFGTETAKSCLLASARGYRSPQYPDGIDVDESLYMSSLIPAERGQLWSIIDCFEGNLEKDRKPISDLVREFNKFPGLKEIVYSIENLINKRSSHASGVLLLEKDPFEHCAFMKTPSGEIITQFDLHTAEKMGNCKYDFLITSVQDKIIECIKLLQKDGLIELDLTLREAYNKYLHPDVLPLQDEKIWETLSNNEVMDCFQFDSVEGAKAVKLVKPHSIIEMSDANSVLRLMPSEKGVEAPLEKYARFKNDISLWYKEMESYSLTPEEQKVLEPHFKPSYGVPPQQEQMMKMVMDKDICGFTLSESNALRKAVAKKDVSKIPEFKKKILTQAKSENLGKYVWDCGIGPQVGYSFSVV